MISQAYQALLHKLSERTEEGTVNWHPTADEGEFVVYLDEFSLSVRVVRDRDEREPSTCYFKIRDHTGAEVDTFWVYEEDSGNWQLAERIYSSARRKALRIDEAVAAILKELDSAQTVGKPTAPPIVDDDDIPF